MKHKLGLQPLVKDPNTFMFENYRTSAKIVLPPSFGVPDGFVRQDGWGMLANGPDPTVDPNFEGCGCCFWAGRAHGIWATIMQGKQTALALPFTSHDVLRGYSACMGYRISDDPNNPTDVGTDPLKGLKYCRKIGLSSSIGTPSTHKLGVFLALEPGNKTQLLEALYLGGTVGLGIQVPAYAEEEFETKKKWSVVSNDDQIVGGHWIEGVSYDHITGLHLVTWGAKIPVTWGFIEKYCDAPFALLSTEILDGTDKHAGLDWATLQADVAAL